MREATGEDLVRHGRAWVFGDNINTDLIAPHRAMQASPDERLRLIFAANRPGWSALVQTGDLIVAGQNFGAGSGRPAARFLLELGIRGVVAESIAGLFLRNAVNHGLPVLECPGVTALISEGDEIDVGFRDGTVRKATGEQIAGNGLPERLLDIVRAGGVLKILAREGYIAENAPALP